MAALETVEGSDGAFEFKDTWRAFLQALYSPQQPFNPFVWIHRLVRAAGRDLLSAVGLNRIDWRRRILPVIPVFALALVVLCTLSYPLSLRAVVRSRWCCPRPGESNDPATDNANETECASNCPWMYLHDSIVMYLPFMILYHFLSACFASPGVVLAKNPPAAWRATAGQGGLLWCDPTFDRAAEKRRTALYGPLEPLQPPADRGGPGGGTGGTNPAVPLLYPSPYASYCRKCDILRPPRAHHCGTSNRCILQYDHFCIWLNNSVGYNNYRSFVLLLFFITITCWYGVAMLFYPFYEPLQAQVRRHGWRWLYANGTGFLDLPPLLTLLRMAIAGTVPSKVVIDIVYPLLFGVGAIMSAFLGYHLKYVVTARTTLEHRVILERSIVTLFHTGSLKPSTVNPFDQGWWKNLQQILGPSVLLSLLPVAILIPAPYLPKQGFIDAKSTFDRHLPSKHE